LGLNDVFTLSSVNPPPQNTTPGGRIERNDCGGIRPCIDSQTGNNSKNAEILGQNLSNAGNPPPGPEGWAAHHIVQSTSTNSTWTRVRNWLADWFIDVNGAENGVWLTSQGLHNAIHSGNYMTWVHDMLARATSRAEAVEILELLRRAILSGSAKY
jgi:hypothetical protein